MATFDLGKLKFNWRGAYADSTAYEVDDVVLHKNGTWICTTDVAATNTTDPEANDNFSRMATGIDFQTADFATSTAYYLNDLVKFDSAVYIVTSDTVTADTGEDPSTLTNDFSIFTPAPEGNVLTTDGDMITRRGGNSIRIPITKTVDKGLTVQKHKTETYPSRSFTYTEDNDNAVTENKSGSIPAASYSITVKNRMSDSYILTGSDRNGNFTNEEEYSLNVNIGDTLTFDTTAAGSSHPLHIRVSNGGDSITAGTGGSYTGEGEDEVVWNTTGMAAGTYFYQCENHSAMVGTIVVTDPTNQQGSDSENASIDCTRGEEYTITLTGLTNTRRYNLFTTDTTHTSATADQVTEGQGNGAVGGTEYTGSDEEVTFSPNETTPNTVYLTDTAGSDARLTINIHDAIYVPSWGEADAAAAAPGAADQRTYKVWQDWYGGDAADQTSGVVSTWGYVLPQSTRDPGAKVKVDGTAVGAQQRRLYRGDSGGATVDWTVPDGVEKVRVTCIGGGGGGGCYSSHYYGGQGGGGGAFASGEYNVEAGDTLRIVAGHGGYGYYSTSGEAGPGGTTTVQDVDGSTIGGKVNLSAEGGRGGQYYGQPEPEDGPGGGGDAVTVSGSSLISGTSIRHSGGHGGYGSNTAVPWGPEQYISGGGGSAGSQYGNGHCGGSGYSYRAGYWCGQSGGGGIGGEGGDGMPNYYPGTYGPTGGASGGGSLGGGRNGKCEYSNQQGYPSYYAGVEGAEGGEGIASSVFDSTYTDHMIRVEGYNAKGEQWSSQANSVDGETDYSLQTDAYNALCGGRFGDGEAEHPANGWDTSLHKGKGGEGAPGFERQKREKLGVGNLPPVQQVTAQAKAFNGILGRLWGGGGAGGGSSSAWGYAFPGGEGGSGAGGGGGSQYTTYAGPNITNGWANPQLEWSVWDVANMAWRMHDKFRTEQETDQPGLVSTSTNFRPLYGGQGGHGGALGGGGAGGIYGSQGGYGGIGGGGGGASSSYSPIYYSVGGHGGPGYILIEWEK